MNNGWGIKAKVKEPLKSTLGDHFVLEFSPSPEYGDLSTPLPFSLAKERNLPPVQVAEDLKKQIDLPILESVTVTKPGYLNFRLNKDFIFQQLSSYHQGNFGSLPKSGKILFEFVSVNPTGPINVANGRAAVLGDVFKKIFNFLGYTAEAEFYINDSGQQVQLLGKSILARIDQLDGKESEIPEDGYHGEYLIPIAKEFKAKCSDSNPEGAGKFGVNEILKMQKKSLSGFGVEFDHWISESKMYEENRVKKVIKTLDPYLFEKDKALWFQADKFGDEKPRVVRTEDNRYTYLVPDLAYHLFKYERGYDMLINIWGPDHHGYIPRIKAGLEALGCDEQQLLILIAQQVNLISKKEKIAMSKRKGSYITLDQLLSEIPTCVARFFYLMRAPSQPLDFNLDLAKETSEENPVYYVQYAHARINSIFDYAREQGISTWQDADLSLLTKKEELNLIHEILKFPDILLLVVEKLEPQKLTHYLIGLANSFHRFYEHHRVVSNNAELSIARLYLVETLMGIIRKGLELLGVEAPTEM